MKPDKEEKRYNQEKQIEDGDVIGKKFEDLSEEEMKNIQGSGSDMNPEFTSSISHIIFSKNGYNC